MLLVIFQDEYLLDWSNLGLLGDLIRITSFFLAISATAPNCILLLILGVWIKCRCSFILKYELHILIEAIKDVSNMVLKKNTYAHFYILCKGSINCSINK